MTQDAGDDDVGQSHRFGFPPQIVRRERSSGFRGVQEDPRQESHVTAIHALPEHMPEDPVGVALDRKEWGSRRRLSIPRNVVMQNGPAVTVGWRTATKDFAASKRRLIDVRRGHQPIPGHAAQGEIVARRSHSRIANQPVQRHRHRAARRTDPVDRRRAPEHSVVAAENIDIGERDRLHCASTVRKEPELGGIIPGIEVGPGFLIWCCGNPAHGVVIPLNMSGPTASNSPARLNQRF